MIVKWDDLRVQFGSTWKNCFDIYDQLKGKTFSQAAAHLNRNHIDSWNEFLKMCALLVEQLTIASIATQHSDADQNPNADS